MALSFVMPVKRESSQFFKRSFHPLLLLLEREKLGKREREREYKRCLKCQRNPREREREKRSIHQGGGGGGLVVQLLRLHFRRSIGILVVNSIADRNLRQIYMKLLNKTITTLI